MCVCFSAYCGRKAINVSDVVTGPAETIVLRSFETQKSVQLYRLFIRLGVGIYQSVSAYCSTVSVLLYQMCWVVRDPIQIYTALVKQWGMLRVPGVCFCMSVLACQSWSVCWKRAPLGCTIQCDLCYCRCAHITSDYEICETFTTFIFSTAWIMLEWSFEVLHKQHDFLERDRVVKDVGLNLKKYILSDGSQVQFGLWICNRALTYDLNTKSHMWGKQSIFELGLYVLLVISIYVFLC